MRQKLLLLFLAAGAVFVYAIAHRLASEGRAILIGALIGMCAGVPAALAAALIAVRRAARVSTEPDAPAPRPAQPQPSVVIVGPGQAPRSTKYAPFLDAMLDSPPPRRFTIVEEDNSDSPAQD